MVPDTYGPFCRRWTHRRVTGFFSFFLKAEYCSVSISEKMPEKMLPFYISSKKDLCIITFCSLPLITGFPLFWLMERSRHPNCCEVISTLGDLWRWITLPLWLVQDIVLIFTYSLWQTSAWDACVTSIKVWIIKKSPEEECQSSITCGSQMIKKVYNCWLEKVFSGLF